MSVLVDGLLLYLNFGQIGDYSKSIYDNLIKYSSLDFNIIKDYEINSNLYKNNRVELLLDRSNNNLNNITKYIENHDISFFHCLNNGFSFPKNSDINNIMTVSNLMPLFFEELCSDKYNSNFFNKFPYSVLKSDRIVCPSVSSKQDLLKNFSGSCDNIFINYGVVSDFFTKTDDVMSSIYLKSKFNLEKEFIIFYGDFNRRKALEEVLILFSKIKSIYPNLYFLICSDNFKDTNYLEELRKLSKSLDLSSYIIFMSNLSILDRVNLFNKALFFIDLSIYENVNLNIVEAYFCKTPVVCSFIDLYREYFGECCFYYNDNIDYICVLDYVQSYSLYNEEYVISKFDKFTNIENTVNIYKEFD